MKAQRTYGLLHNGPIYALKEQQKEKREKEAESLFKEIMGLLELGEENRDPDSRLLAELIRINSKKSIVRYLIIKVSKMKDKDFLK